MSDNVQNPSFTPRFVDNPYTKSDWGLEIPLNPFYFATEETAKALVARLGALVAVPRPAKGIGGPWQVHPETQWYLVWPQGVIFTSREGDHVFLDNILEVNAGIVAENYRPGKWPDEKAADRAVQDLLYKTALGW